MTFLHKAIATTTLLVAACLAGCAVAPQQSGNWLDDRLAWPCDRLVLVWSVDAAQLQSIVAPGLRVRMANGSSELYLNIMRCGPIGAVRAGATPLRYAMLTIPVDAETVPMVITSIPIDGWYSLPQVIADASTAPIFTQLGYDVLDGDISFAEISVDRQTPFELRLTFDGGRLSVRAVLTGEQIEHDTSVALLDGGVDYWAVFFGEETGTRYARVEAEVRIEGETPLSTFNLSSHPNAAMFDRALTSNRFFWRQPLHKP